MTTRQSIDERQLHELIEESQDLHHDSMRPLQQDLKDYAEAAAEARHERSRSGSLLAGAGLAGVGVLAMAGSARADDNDIAMLQTAASLENLAVATYGAALKLDFINNGNAVVKKFAQTTMSQHAEHGKAFNAAAKNMGGKEQNSTNPKYTPVVEQAKPGLKTPLDVVKLAITLEGVATETYVRNIQNVSTGELRQLFGSVAGVESQHRGTLFAVQALLMADMADLIKIPTDVAKLPAAAGSASFPDTFAKNDLASPAEEGAVK